MYKRALLLTTLLIITNMVLSVSAALPLFHKGDFTKEKVKRFFIAEIGIVAFTLFVFLGTAWFYDKYSKVIKFTEPMLFSAVIIVIATIVAKLTTPTTDDYFVELFDLTLPWLEFVKILFIHFGLPSMVLGIICALFPRFFTCGLVLFIIYWISVFFERVTPM